MSPFVSIILYPVCSSLSGVVKMVRAAVNKAAVVNSRAELSVVSILS